MSGKEFLFFFRVVSTFRNWTFPTRKNQKKRFLFLNLKTLQPPPPTPETPIIFQLALHFSGAFTCWIQLRGVLFFPWVQNSVGFGMNPQFLGSEKTRTPFGGAWFLRMYRCWTGDRGQRKIFSSFNVFFFFRPKRGWVFCLKRPHRGMIDACQSFRRLWCLVATWLISWYRGRLHTQNECRMYDAGRTTLREMFLAWLAGRRDNDILEERHLNHNGIEKTCAFDELNSHEGKSHDICHSSFCRLCQACCAIYNFKFW